MRLPSPTSPRTFAVLVGVVLVVAVLVVLVAAGVLGGCVLGGCSGAQERGAGSPRLASGAVRGDLAASDVPADLAASDVLHSWDAARAQAYASGDVAALRTLYVSGSAAGTSDVRLLRGYLRRGLRVEGMRMQVLALDVLDEQPHRLRFRVTDRLAGGVAVGKGSRVTLPRDAASARVVELVREPGGLWQVDSVRESSPRRAVR